MENQTNNQPETLSVTDLYVVKQIIEQCAQRGAFSADEMSVVGDVYQKLLRFLKTIEPTQEETDTETASVDSDLTQPQGE